MSVLRVEIRRYDKRERLRRWRIRCAVLWLAVLLAGSDGLSAAVAGPDSVRTGITGSPRFYPGVLWSSTVGVGIGVGYRFRNVTGPGSSLLLIAKPSLRRGIYEASYLSDDPYSGRSYVGASVYYETTGRTRYYGLGPFSSADTRVFIDDEYLRLRTTGGTTLARSRLLVQPVAEVLYVQVDAFMDDDPGDFDRLGPDSRASLQRMTSIRADEGYLAGGIEAGWFLSRGAPRSGSSLQMSAERVQPITNGDPGFWRFSGVALLDAFLVGRPVTLRALYATVDGRTDQVPYYLLPRLGGRLLPGYARSRFRGNTILAINGAIRQPLIDMLGFGGIDLVLMVGAGSVYDDFASQFSPRISFAKEMTARDRVPLRPAASVGFRAYAGSRPYEITVAAGISPERMSIVTFRLHRDVRHRHGLLSR